MNIQFSAATEITISPSGTTVIPQRVITIPEKKKTINSITVLSMTDEPNIKKVSIKTLEIGLITLWEGEAYDEIGQWTDQDVIDRIKEIYNIV